MFKNRYLMLTIFMLIMVTATMRLASLPEEPYFWVIRVVGMWLLLESGSYAIKLFKNYNK